MREEPDTPRSRGFELRMAIPIILLWAGLIAVVGRVGYLQLVKGEALDKKGETQTSHRIELNAKRGAILDRHGTELAVSVEVPSIFARPHKISSPERAARRLLPHLDSTHAELSENLSGGEHFVWLQRQAKPASAEAIRELQIKGVSSVPENKRFYPLRSRAGQVVGFVGIDGEGLEGIERSMNEELSGGTFYLHGIRDAHGRAVLTNELPRFQRLEGNSVSLTLDERVQRVTERVLEARVAEADAKNGSAVVMDVSTGDILAMATTPRFDPNRFDAFDSSDWRLKPLTDTFEPGSVVKPFVLGGYLNKGLGTLDTTYDTEDGRFQVGKHTIRDTHAHKELTAKGIIEHSSNIGAYKLARELKPRGLYRYFKRFGMGEPTGVELPGEQPGVLRSSDNWAEVTFANIAFGQGFTSNVLQLTSALSAIANDGMLMQPKIVRKVIDKDGNTVEENRPVVKRQVIEPETARKVKQAMSAVVSEEGTGTKAMIDGYEVAGKTGTAQKVNPKTQQYDSDLWVASFGGFAPVEDPEIACMVVINEPEGTHYGGALAGPVFRKIMKSTLAIHGIETEQGPSVPQLEKGRDDEMDEKSQVEEKAIDSEEAKQTGVPDLRGMTLRKALHKAESHELEPSFHGWGVVKRQSPEPGTDNFPADRKVELYLKPLTQSRPRENGKDDEDSE